MRRLLRRGSGCSRCPPPTRGRVARVGRTGRQTRRGAPSRSFSDRRHASKAPFPPRASVAREPHPPPPPKYYCARPAERHLPRGARFKDPGPPAEIPGEMSAAQSAPVERPLWLTVPGASAAVLLGWVVWLILAALAPALVAASLGPPGAILPVVTLGWWLARRAPEPGEALRRYHLDEAEVIAMGPGTAVRRLPWSEVVTLTETRHALVLEGRGTRLRLPLAAAVRSALLDRVAAGLAAELWALLDEGETVRFGPATDPLPRALACWVYVPALAAGLAGGETAGLAVGLVVVLVERAVAGFRRRVSSVTLDRGGVRLGRVFVPWSDAEVRHAEGGLQVGARGGACVLVPTRIANFWAAVPVIETKAQLGPYSATVRFRVRRGDRGLALVGEVEPTA